LIVVVSLSLVLLIAMKPKLQSLLEMCIDDGITIALNTSEHPDDLTALSNQLRKEIWLQLDTYFTFEE